MGSGSVATYYDRLGRWNRFARGFGFGGGHDALTVHRALADPRANGRPTMTRLHDILIERLRALRAPRLLDAGCGLGGTMIAFATEMDAVCTGLTLSTSQATTANVAARRLGLSDRVNALVRSYDEPPPGPFDVVIAIESLAHSPHPEASVRALAAVLTSGGTLVVVDDMPRPEASSTPDLATFKSGWHCPVLFGEEAYRKTLGETGFHAGTIDDLTSECRPRAMWHIAGLSALNRCVHRLAPFDGLKQVMNAHHGGLALERLIRSGLVRYQMLVATKR
jgi:SAM-dependent methyltransferase